MPLLHLLRLAPRTPSKVPIPSIPLEILLQIFFCIHDSVDHTAIEPPSSPLGAARLACRFWDVAVKENAGFWTTLVLHLSTFHHDAGWFTLLALHLKRSKDLPLDIVLSGRGSVHRRVLDVLGEHVARWRSIKVPHPYGINPIEDLLAFQMPNLITLDVKSTDTECLMTTLDAPNLQTLVWGGGGIFFAGDRPPPLQVMNLQECNASGWSGNVPFESICKLQDTIQELSYAPAPDTPLLNGQRTTFHRLHTLRLGAMYYTLDWLSLMGCCQFPNLHTFGIKLGDHLPSMVLPELPSVRRLEWVCCYFSVEGGGREICRVIKRPEYLEPFLSAFPNLSNISFVADSRDGENSELSVLARRSEGRVNDCVELEEIEMYCASLDVLDDLTVRRPFLKSISMKRWHTKDDQLTHENRTLLLERIRSRIRLVVQLES